MAHNDFSFTSSDPSHHTDELKPADNLAAAYGNLLMAAMLLSAERALSGESDALTDAAHLVEDALSQIRGERQARLPEYPIWEGRP